MIKNNLKKFLILKCKSKNRSKFLLTVLLFVYSNIGFAKDKTLTVHNISASSFISGDISPNQAKKEALNTAKINALKAAGIEEHISSYQSLFTNQSNNDFKQFFNSNVLSEIEGIVQSYRINKERYFVNNQNEILYEVNIDAVIIKYSTKPDPKFDFNMEGIKASYNNDENLQFSITPSLSSYLYVFNISETEATLMYPNSYENGIQLEGGKKYLYPTTNILNYQMHTDKNNYETVRLIFVLTKEQIPFVKMDKEQKIEEENIFSWIYSITPSDRKITLSQITINKL